jgi:hypothetical protein
MTAATYRLRRVIGGDYSSEYQVIDRDTGATLGWVGLDRPGHWVAETPQGFILADIDIDTRAEAVGVVLHPERVGLAPR